MTTNTDTPARRAAFAVSEALAHRGWGPDGPTLDELAALVERERTAERDRLRAALENMRRLAAAHEDVLRDHDLFDAEAIHLSDEAHKEAADALANTTQPDPVREAAPDLLEAAKRALFVMESPVIEKLANGAGTVDTLRAAIAKAERT